MAAGRPRDKGAVDFADIFHLEASKEEIQADVLKIIEDLRSMVEATEGKAGGADRYAAYLAMADAIREEARAVASGKRTRKRKRVFEFDGRGSPRRGGEAMAPCGASGQPVCRKGVAVGS
ncbi:unnamed protein product [Ostreobium quekettii]|uniref:Uncharacterized protein n=1 Tax=Ostreobium quekettii TaxID=121088 RepID=A0A8S1IW29_9CHLO|nr:unnamed protein product [Ostreobium quekettii]